jgi:DNA replication protein DnaC
MASNFEKFNPYASDKFKVDLRSYAQKAIDYMNSLAKEAGAEKEKFVRNALWIVRSFSLNHSLIDSQARMIEKRLSKRIEEKRSGNSNLPNEVFRDGVINTGKVIGSNIDAKLKIEHFSGNLTIYGTYGMGKTNLILSIIPQLIRRG